MNYQFLLDLKKHPPTFDKEDLGRWQIRFICKDIDPQVKNKKLILSRGYFHTPCFLSYEKHFTRDGKSVVECYTDDILDMYFETTHKGNMEIVEGFGAAGDLFHREIKHFENGKHFKSEIMVLNADGNISYQTDYY